MTRVVRITVSNESSSPKALWLEPWGEDYWMAPEEKLEIVARDVDDNFHFHVDVGEDVF